MTSKFITVVIPALNEWKVIRYPINTVFHAFEKYHLKGECLIMDSSTDGWITQKAAEELWARVINIPRQWLGKAYIDSISYIKGDYVIMGDADGTYDFMEMDGFITKLDAGYDFVMGSRLRGNIHKWAMPWKNRYIGTPLLTFFINLFFRAWISDCNSWLRALTKAAFIKMQMESRWWEYASEMVVKAKLTHMKMCELPVSLLADREWRKPHLPAYAAGWANLKYIMLLASEFIFLKLGAIIWFLGIIILLSQILGPINFLWKTFWTFYLFLWILLRNIWFSIFQMGILTQNFSYLNKFRITKISKRVANVFTFERWLVSWWIWVLIWFFMDLWVLVHRIQTWNIDIISFRIWLYALFFMITWIQLIYFSFLFYLFNKHKN